MALVRPVGCDGKTGRRSAEATGFLVGSQVVMTATSVVADATARGCGLQVRLGGRWYGAMSAQAWYDARSTAQDVDLATVELNVPASGYVFRFARALPRRGTAVAALGHPLGLPLNFQQGLLRQAAVTRGVPSVTSWIVAEGGSRGGPIVDSDGRVIGVVSRTAVPEEDSVDGGNFVGGLNLAQWFGASASRDLCRAHPQHGIPDCPVDLTLPGPRQSASLGLRGGIAESAPEAPSTVTMRPETLARVASGVGFLRFSDCEGGGGVSGFAVDGSTGFLVGSQVVMTARHVVIAARSRGCRVQVQLNGSRYGVAFAKAWYDARSRPRDVDLATLKLTRPASGYVFRFARGLPRRDDIVATLGHPLGLPLNIQQGVFRRAGVSRGVPTVATRMTVAAGNSGGPIVRSDGGLIGVVALFGLEDGSGTINGPNLAQWFGGSAGRDLCRAYPRGGIPGCPADSARPGPRRWLPLKLHSG